MSAAIPEDILRLAKDEIAKGEMAIVTVARAILAERERISAIVSKWKRRDHLSLHAGEVTAQEFRTVVAVLISIEAAIRQPTGE